MANALKLSNARLSKLARVMCTCSPAAGWCAPARHPPHLWVWLPPPPLNTQFQVCARPVNAVNPRVVDVVIPTTAQRSSKTRWVGVWGARRPTARIHLPQQIRNNKENREGGGTRSDAPQPRTAPDSMYFIQLAAGVLPARVASVMLGNHVAKCVWHPVVRLATRQLLAPYDSSCLPPTLGCPQRASRKSSCCGVAGK